MSFLQEYAWNLISCSLLCSILVALLPKGKFQEVLKGFCGLFMLLSFLNPFVSITTKNWDNCISDIQIVADDLVLSGKKQAQNTAARLIQRNIEAYILEKTSEWNTELIVEIQLNESNIPDGAILSGDITPSQKIELARILESDLGITKERQEWTGSKDQSR